MPGPDQLPADLESFAYRNAAPLRADPDFDTDAARLVRDLRRSLQTGAAGDVDVAAGLAPPSGTRISDPTEAVAPGSALLGAVIGPAGRPTDGPAANPPIFIQATGLPFAQPAEPVRRQRTAVFAIVLAVLALLGAAAAVTLLRPQQGSSDPSSVTETSTAAGKPAWQPPPRRHHQRPRPFPQRSLRRRHQSPPRSRRHLHRPLSVRPNCRRSSRRTPSAEARLRTSSSTTSELPVLDNIPKPGLSYRRGTSRTTVTTTPSSPSGTASRWSARRRSTQRMRARQGDPHLGASRLRPVLRRTQRGNHHSDSGTRRRRPALARRVLLGQDELSASVHLDNLPWPAPSQGFCSMSHPMERDVRRQKLAIPDVGGAVRCGAVPCRTAAVSRPMTGS